MEARKMANHQFIDRPMGILGLFFFKGLLNFLTKEETLTQVRWLLTSEVNNYLFITDYFQYKIGIAFQLALHTNQNSLNKWTKILANPCQTNSAVLDSFFFYFFEILLAPSELPLPRKSELIWQVSRYFSPLTLGVLGGVQSQLKSYSDLILKIVCNE